MSKSKGNIIDPLKMIEKFGKTAVRFYFLTNGPHNHDISYDEQILIKSFNKIPDGFSNIK